MGGGFLILGLRRGLEGRSAAMLKRTVSVLEDLEGVWSMLDVRRGAKEWMRVYLSYQRAMPITESL
jgi:hypothetical protein